MKMVMVAVRDVATGSFASPIGVAHNALAIRSFQSEVSNAESQICRHPEDFELFALGEFDTETGEFTAGVARLCRALDFVRSSADQKG